LRIVNYAEIKMEANHEHAVYVGSEPANFLTKP
jgi:hypothetical protein